MDLKDELNDHKTFWKIMQPYRQAIKVMKMKLESIDDELKCENGYSPIHNIQTRIKSPESIIDKLQRKQYPLRVICQYINDIQYISQLLIMHDDII